MPAEFFVSKGTKNREAVVAALSGVETPEPTSTGLNICSKKEKKKLQEKYPDLKFRSPSAVTRSEAQDRPVKKQTPVKIESPTSFGQSTPAVFKSSASRFQALVGERKMKRMSIEKQTAEVSRSDDNPLQAVNGEQSDEVEDSIQDAQRDIDDSADSNEEKESAEKPTKESVQESSAVSPKHSAQESVEKSTEAPAKDPIDDSNKTLVNATSEDPSKTTPSKSSSKATPAQPPKSTRRVLFVQPTSRTYRNRRLPRAEDKRSEDEDEFHEAKEHFEESQKTETQEQFETAPDHSDEKDDDDSDEPQTPTKSTSHSTSEPSSQTPSKTHKSTDTPSKIPKSIGTPSKTPKLSDTPSKTPKSPKNASQPSEPPQSLESKPQMRTYKRRRAVLDEDDGFEDIEATSENQAEAQDYETEFSREQQAEFFVLSDHELNSDEEDENGKQEEDDATLNQAELNVTAGGEEEYIPNAGDDFADEFVPLHPMRLSIDTSPSRKRQIVQRREPYTPSKDRLLLESSLAARKLAIPLKDLYKQLQQVIGHTEFSLQSRLSKLELNQSLQDAAYSAPLLEGVAVSDVISKILHKHQKKRGPPLRRRIPFTDLDDMSIKAFVADLDPQVRGYYSSYEPFAERFTHHDASSVKGRWMKTLASRTSELELMEAKQNYTPVVQRQHLEMLRQAYPALYV